MKCIDFIKKNGRYIIIFLMFLVLSYFFPNTSKDLYWSKIDKVKDISAFYALSNGKLLFTSIVILLTKFKLFKIIVYSVFSVSLFVTLRNIVNKKNNTLMYIGIFLFLIIGTDILNSSYTWTTGFTNNFIPSVLILLMINLNIKNNYNKLNPFIIFILGLILGSFDPLISLFVLLVVIIEVIYKSFKKLSIKSYNNLLLGIISSTALMCFFHKKSKILFLSGKYTENILHEVIPKLYDVNFLIILIFIALLLFLCIKIFLKGSRRNRQYTVLSMIVITLFGLNFISNKNYLIDYGMYVLFTVVSIFVLLNANSSIIFKRKIKIYYFYKVMYLFMLCFSSNIHYSYFIFPVLIDILIILEIINYIFPNNFLEKAWYYAIILLLGANIYLYNDVYDKHLEANRFIKNHLECSMYDFVVPSKYDTNYLYKPIPKEYEDKMYFIDYYDLKLYGNVYNYIYK